MSIKYDKKEIQTFASISDVLYRNIRDPNTLSTTPSKQKKDVSLRISDLSESSLFILSKENIFRKFLIKIVLSKWFDKPLSKFPNYSLFSFPFPLLSGPFCRTRRAAAGWAGMLSLRKREKRRKERGEVLRENDGEKG